MQNDDRRYYHYLPNRQKLLNFNFVMSSCKFLMKFSSEINQPMAKEGKKPKRLPFAKFSEPL